MGDSRKATSASSDCTPQLMLTTTSNNVEHSGPEVVGNTSDTRENMLPEPGEPTTERSK